MTELDRPTAVDDPAVPPAARDAVPPAARDAVPPRQHNGKVDRARLLLLGLLGAGAVVFVIYHIAGELIRQNRQDARFSPQREVSLEESRNPLDDRESPQGDGKSSLQVAIAPVISPEKSLSVYRGFVDYLAAKVDKAPVVLRRETYAQVNDLVRFRRCHMAFVCTYAFVRGEREFGMEVLAVPEIGGVVTYHSLILVPKSSKASSLTDLRGKRFASADLLSNSGWLYPVVWLGNHGHSVLAVGGTADGFFKEHVITGSHDRSVAAVASGYVDGAAVDSLVYEQMVEEDPTIAARTKVVLKSPPFGMPPVVVHPEIDPDLREQLLATLLQMHATQQGRSVLNAMRIDRFVVPDDELYDGVREAAKVLESRR